MIVKNKNSKIYFLVLGFIVFVSIVLTILSFTSKTSSQPINSSANSNTTLVPTENTENRSVLYEKYKWDPECEKDFKEFSEVGFGAEMTNGIKLFSLGNKKTLVEVMCQFGAYQGTFAYTIYDESGATPKRENVIFKTYDSSSKVLKPLNVGILCGMPVFDVEKKELSTLCKGRGLGDTGEYSVFKYADSQFKLKLLTANSEKDNQDVNGIVPFEKWKIIFQEKTL